MTEKRTSERTGLESAKLWLEQRKQKSANSASVAPHTPPAQRTISTFSSPGSILGKEEDVVIIELTSRYLCAGLEGESGPQCKIAFDPASCKRTGDYRVWLPGYERKREPLQSWGRGYELWRNDLGGLDLGLMSDILERTMRDVYNKHLLVDAGAGRLVLVVPSLVPHPVLNSILSTCFERWKYSNITLLPSPTMAVVSAGLRSGLVVDIGWEETVITSIYEYREIGSSRSSRAMKMLTHNFATLLKEKQATRSEFDTLRFDLGFVEEVLSRALATLDRPPVQNASADDDPNVALQARANVTSPTAPFNIEFSWPGVSASHFMMLSDQDLATILSETYIGETTDRHLDDDEIMLPRLIFGVLLSLTPDVRGVCMSRIIFTGDGSVSSFLRQRIMDRVDSLVRNIGWTRVERKSAANSQSNTNGMIQVSSTPADAKHDRPVIAEKDYIEEKLLKQKSKVTPVSVQGSLREVRSLGPWAGASLLTSLKIRGFVEIERERFLSHRLPGATRDTETSLAAQQHMSSFSLTTIAKATDRTSWTLGVWG